MSGLENKTCWIATDGAAGNQNQCLALAHYMGLEAEVFRIGLRQPWKMLAPHFRSAGRLSLLGDINKRLSGPLPDLLLTAGRLSVLASVTIKRLSRGQTFTVQLLNPRIDPTHFDLVVCPRHDLLSAPNVINTLGSLHRVDEQTLALARQRWAEQLEALPSPRVAVLIGASNAAYRIDRDYLNNLARIIEDWLQAEGGSVMVSTAGRSPDSLRAFCRQRFADLPGSVWTGGLATDNPYLGFLAWADRIVVSPDSVNMISEACGTGKPVHCTAPLSTHARFNRFHQNLRDAGLVVPLEHSGVVKDRPPLTETRKLARELLDRFAAR